MTQKYLAAAKDDLIWHALDSMTLLFHRPSGMTHMLTDPAPAILEVMDASPLTAAELARRLGTVFDLETDIDVENIVIARLDELSALGLVSRVPD